MTINRYGKTSIIILTYNKLEYTKACIESIRKYTARGSFQLIVVDNCSTDGTRDWLIEQTDILTVFNDTNVGFPRGCNQGIEIATGDDILLLNNDVLVTEDWLVLMKQCLYSSDDIGAVGPVTNSAYGDQEIDVAYTTVDEMWEFGNAYNHNTAFDWEQKLKLIGFCMLIKRDVVEQVGLLDEIFSPGMCEDSDYSFRIMESGYKLLLCRNVFIHHFGSTSFGDMPEQRQLLWSENRRKFEEKWGFHTSYHTQPREDLVELINKQDRNKQISVLDVGCGCGATLLRVKYKFPNACLHGIEKNEQAAQIASRVGSIILADAEALLVQSRSYDYIILGDILQQLNDPWSYVLKIKEALKPEGQIIASVPNASHYSIIYSLINNRPLYQNDGVLGSETKRLFALQDIEDLFIQSGFEKVNIIPVLTDVPEVVERYIEQLHHSSPMVSTEYFKTKFYLVNAKLNDTLLVDELLRQVDKGNKSALEQIINLVESGAIHSSTIINEVSISSLNKQSVLNVLATSFFVRGLYNDIIPLLNASLLINPKHHDTLYNYAYILHSIGENEEAMRYIAAMEEMDEESTRLYEELQNTN